MFDKEGLAPGLRTTQEKKEKMREVGTIDRSQKEEKMGMERYSISVVDNFLIARRDSYKSFETSAFLKDTNHSTWSTISGKLLVVV